VRLDIKIGFAEALNGRAARADATACFQIMNVIAGWASDLIGEEFVEDMH
jgi:hypothetical protein